MKNFNCLQKSLILKCGLLTVLAMYILFTPDARCAYFIDSGQELGNSSSNGVALGDIDGDGDIDAFVANTETNQTWINQGGNQGGTPGDFQPGQTLEESKSNNVALGDIDGDNDLDAFFANHKENKVWINQGGKQGGTPGKFEVSAGQTFGNSYSTGVALGDVDGDNDLDAFVANMGTDIVWINDGNGNFSTGKFLNDGGDSFSWSVALGHFNEDNHLDAFVANIVTANIVWINDGTGNFPENLKKDLGDKDNSVCVAVGDFDGDADPDAFVAISGPPNKIWVNKGGGLFEASDNTLGTSGKSDSYGVSLGDIDGDGDLDAFEANNNKQANKIWLNDGKGNFSEFQNLGASDSRGVSLDDLDGDGDLDAFVVNTNQPNKVWLNAGDADNNGAINLSDAILVLKAVAGINPVNINPGADVSRDSKIGIEEAVFILQMVSGLR